MELQEYKTKADETISMWKDGPNYFVSCDTETENRWLKSYRNKDEANVEFERWRK